MRCHSRLASSAMLLRLPGMKWWRATYRCARWCKALRRRRYARALDEVAEPLVAHVSEARLSPAIHRVRSWTWRVSASTALCAMVPASSRSEIEMVPRGCSQVTSSICTLWGKGERHTMGAVEGSNKSNHTPPIPSRQASQDPVSDGATGTNS